MNPVQPIHRYRPTVALSNDTDHSIDRAALNRPIATAIDRSA